ncbi:MAG: ATP-binding cassette domain-containing protein [Clostridiales bacterium]|nr:ATP-binding cassette domain-containing protein [Clostridiales bacterium]
MSNIIQFNNICKDFKISVRKKGIKNALIGFFKREHKTIEALKNVSFEIEEGDIVGYIGPNGAGKSTTIKIMSGILTPTSGSCSILGFTPWKDRKQYVSNIGVVFGQRSQLWWDVPIIDSFELLKDIYKIPNKEYEETLNELIETLNLKELLNRPLRQLSLGQKMKCELAGSLLHRPKILFLDEPTIGLDAVTKLAVRDFIKEINKKWGTTIILTTHDMSDIDALTNKIILIGRGQILYKGSFSAIKHKYDRIKQIEVEFKEKYDKIEFDGYEVISHNQNMAVLKNLPETTFNTKDFINEISKKYEVVDFSVKSISVDEILAQLYTELKL